MRIDREDPDDLGFAFACLFAGTITRAEFRSWVDGVFLAVAEPPSYMAELGMFPDAAPLTELYRIVPFVPHVDLSDEERDALDGIGALRGKYAGIAYEPHITVAQALGALERNLHVLERVLTSFPSVEIPLVARSSRGV